MIRDDNGGEFIGEEYYDFCAEHGIQWQHTEPHEPHQNDVAQHTNEEIVARATALLVQAKLPPSFWSLAPSAYIYTSNRTPTSSLGGGIPYAHWTRDVKVQSQTEVQTRTFEN